MAQNKFAVPTTRPLLQRLVLSFRDGGGGLVSTTTNTAGLTQIGGCGLIKSAHNCIAHVCALLRQPGSRMLQCITCSIALQTRNDKQMVRKTLHCTGGTTGLLLLHPRSCQQRLRSLYSTAVDCVLL